MLFQVSKYISKANYLFKIRHCYTQLLSRHFLKKSFRKRSQTFILCIQFVQFHNTYGCLTFKVFSSLPDHYKISDQNVDKCPYFFFVSRLYFAIDGYIYRSNLDGSDMVKLREDNRIVNLNHLLVYKVKVSLLKVELNTFCNEYETLGRNI